MWCIETAESRLFLIPDPMHSHKERQVIGPV